MGRVQGRTASVFPKSTLPRRGRRLGTGYTRFRRISGTSAWSTRAGISDTGGRHDRSLPAHAAHRSTGAPGGRGLGAREQAGRVPLPRPGDALSGPAVVSGRHRMDRQAP